MRYAQKTILLIVFVLAASGCATTGMLGGRQPLSERVTASQIAWRAGGTPFLGDRLPAAGLAPEDQLQNMLDRLVFVSPLRGHAIRLAITGSGPGFAGTDGKTVYIHPEVLNQWGQDESLIAGVMAHELGHIVAHHAENRNTGRPETSLLQAAAPLFGLTRWGPLASTALRESFTIRNRACSRDDEKEADAIGAILAHEAGYDIYGLARFLQHVSAQNGSAMNLTLPVTNYANPSSAAQGAALFLLRASPYYRTHPGHDSRELTIARVAGWKQGLLSTDILEHEDPELADILKTLEARRPKNRP